VVGLVNLANRLRDTWVFGCIALDVGPDAFTMESVLAWVDKELTIIKDRAEADIAVLSRVDCDVPIFHVTSLGTQFLCVFRVLTDLTTQILYLLLVIVETVAQVFLHITDFSFLREQVEQIFNFQYVVFADD